MLVVKSSISSSVSCMIHQSESQGLWKGIKICKETSAITHLLYADDSLFFMEASSVNFMHVKQLLDCYCRWSGQKINRSKSVLVFSPSTSHEDKTDLAGLFQISFSPKLGKYLGTWIDPGKQRSEVYSQVLNAVSKCTAAWKTQLLSQVSRLMLIKSVLSAANIYQFSCIKFPSYICQKIDSKCIDFFWGSLEDQRKMHLRAKEHLFQPISSGGLGLRSTETVNQSLLAKQL